MAQEARKGPYAISIKTEAEQYLPGVHGTDYSTKKIIVADLDGTLTPSKSMIEPSMVELLTKLLGYKDFAVIGGGRYSQFQNQFVEGLPSSSAAFSRLYLFPTCATTFYRFVDGAWRQIYAENLSPGERAKIKKAFEKALNDFGYKKPEYTFGEIIEDRGTQITFSALGQQAPIEFKSVWDPGAKKRQAIKGYLEKLIPEFEVTIGGMTSIDVTRKGIDKAHGIMKIKEYLGYGIGEMLFIGDALFEGGNDYPVKRTGVECIAVNGPDDTEKIIAEIIRSCERKR